MANVIDTIEIHKAVEDPDRVDTSAGNTSATLRILDTGEIEVLGEYLGKQFEQTLPHVAVEDGFVRVLIFDTETTGLRVAVVEAAPSEKILYALTSE